ncbi:hypothetical protein SDJN02_00742, partial [Cucurbita argyrosperma subsp. argyrosperma]
MSAGYPFLLLYDTICLHQVLVALRLLVARNYLSNLYPPQTDSCRFETYMVPALYSSPGKGMSFCVSSILCYWIPSMNLNKNSSLNFFNEQDIQNSCNTSCRLISGIDAKHGYLDTFSNLMAVLSVGLITLIYSIVQLVAVVG